MALAAQLQLRQAQSLVMTPQLLQSIRLLQLPRAELDRFIDGQIEQNPLLERQTAGPDDQVAGRQRPVATGMAGATDHGWSPELVAAPRQSLRAYLCEQIALALPDAADRAIALYLTDWLDERGYFDGSIEQAAEALGVDAARVGHVLGTLRGLEPAGVFGRDLADCLALQCARRDRLDPAMRTLLDHLDLLARREFATLSRLCGVDVADLLDMLAEIRTLRPRPAAAFDDSPVQSIMHDAQVLARPDGSWRVELNGDAMPRVLVDRDYHANVCASGIDDAGKAFMTRCLNDAGWLERSLDQRASTILKVATEIVRRQDGFLTDGVRALRPLTMKAVAEQISMHESTVSRVVANKFLLTPRGMFEFRFFFAGGVAAADGDSATHASESVRDRIRTLIETEAADNVLSDDALVGLLRDQGIDIARRTVAKYREAMNIASSVRRRREKRAVALVAG